jgi:hypothetical protein
LSNAGTKYIVANPCFSCRFFEPRGFESPRVLN